METGYLAVLVLSLVLIGGLALYAVAKLFARQ
jgi:hypothetical protein